MQAPNIESAMTHACSNGVGYRSGEQGSSFTGDGNVARQAISQGVVIATLLLLGSTKVTS